MPDNQDRNRETGGKPSRSPQDTPGNTPRDKDDQGYTGSGKGPTEGNEPSRGTNPELDRSDREEAERDRDRDK